MNNPAKRQQIKFFIKELIAFAILFLALGVVVYFLFHKSVYHNINQGLYSQRERILRDDERKNRFTSQFNPGYRHPPAPNNAPFRTNVITFDKYGRIDNSSMLGLRNYELLSQINLTKDTLEKEIRINKIQSLTLRDSSLATHFRILLLKVPTTNHNPQYAGKYVLILENIDSDLLAVNSFKRALIITLIFFWIVAITTAYFLSRSSMKPIVKSWNKQREFSANASHELRTPLTVIQNQLEYLFTKPSSKVVNQAQSISTALDEVRHLRTLTSQLLTLARSDANMIQINRKDIDIKKWLNKIIPPYQEIAEYQHKVLQTKLNISHHGNFDPDLMRELLVILFDNALKYTPEHGSIEINIQQQTESRLKMSVSDTGRGISDADKKQIFERFYRTDKSRNEKTGGNGLGLTMAKWIVNQHHGQINVSDNHPHGTIFTVQIKD